jgi:hypothetical protein
MVSEDYALEKLQKLLFSNGLTAQNYILKSERYGTNTSKKAEMLKEELCPECEDDPGFPQNYVFTAEGELLYYGAGAIPVDTLAGIGIQL